MKILRKDLKRGYVTVAPETLDDLWVLYNVILPKDGVYAKTTRVIKIEKIGARPTKGERVPVSLGIIVENVAFDRAINRLRVRGIIVEAPEDVGIKGTYHTIDVVVGKSVTISKVEWLKHQLDRLRAASEYRATSIIVVALDDENCGIAVLRHYGFDVKVEIDAKLPGKREAKKRAEGFLGYFKNIADSLVGVKTEIKGPIVIVGPGFVKNEFSNYLKEKYPDLAMRVIAVKGVGSAGVAGVHEALRCGLLTSVAKRVRAVEETKEVEEVFSRLGKGRKDVAYGLNEVEKAVGYGAVNLLLISDSLLREAVDEDRKRLEATMRSAEKIGGRVILVSTEHEAGEKLLSLGGVAALLRFSIS